MTEGSGPDDEVLGLNSGVGKINHCLKLTQLWCYNLPVVAAVSLEPERDWLIRPYDAACDVGLEYLLGVSYARGSAGRRANASRAGWRTHDATHPVPDRQAVDDQTAFLESYRPVWAWLLRHADVTLAVDRLAPETSIWAWLITSEPNVVHACGAKRSCIENGLGQELVLDLLGSRASGFQVVTLELPQMRAQRPGWKASKDLLGFDRPKGWSFDPGWIAVHMAASR